MQQQRQQIERLVQDIDSSSFELNVQMIKLDTVQDAVARLMEHINEIQHKGWDKDRGMAYLAIGEIEQTVRLIDMAFLPFKKEMNETVKNLKMHSNELYDIVIKQADNNRLDINSLLGWNYFAMEGNIKTFIREFGREPENFEEVAQYITETSAKVVANHEARKQEELKKADARTSASEI